MTVMTYAAVAVVHHLSMVGLQPFESLAFSAVGRDHTGQAHNVALADADRDKLFQNLNVT